MPHDGKKATRNMQVISAICDHEMYVNWTGNCDQRSNSGGAEEAKQVGVEPFWWFRGGLGLIMSCNIRINQTRQKENWRSYP